MPVKFSVKFHLILPTIYVVWIMYRIFEMALLLFVIFQSGKGLGASPSPPPTLHP